MEKYTVCLCGEYCFSKKDILRHYRVIDNDYYIVINDELIPVNFDKYIVSEPGFFYEEYDCVTIDFENILKFNSLILSEKLFSKLNHHKFACNYFKFIINYFEHIAKNNIINHIKYYLKNNYYNDLSWNFYLREKIFRYSNVSTIRSCLKYLPIEYMDFYFFYSISRNDDTILDYLVNKIGIYWTSYFTGKKYKGNMFKITNKNKLVNKLDIYNISCGIINYNKKKR
ncbi:hypothetical protein qu_931 [Acanthamoeba polyphaga mimivirus]|nr:hypothetical protein [Mimivirus reunion]WMV62265.1 hypothetical protein qu_931 [Mimivirus sp.]WMV63242.1 hypothetical protein qu_931 [Acanthamoeba polyphaga mimivirus]WMV64219.1 hypothetical protein qu_931 [Mimivirus sp.]